MPAQEILAAAQEERFVIEDFTPLADSIEWDLGQQYLRLRGSKAFISDTSPVPFVINNDGLLSCQAAEVFFSSLVEAEVGPACRAGPEASARTDSSTHVTTAMFSRGDEVPPGRRDLQEIFVLELGIGVGLFARFFLDAFKSLCDKHGKDYYRRLRYVAGDRSERMLADACRSGVFANHAGHVFCRVVDALEPEKYLRGDALFGNPLTSCAAPFHAVFLNYLLDCLPAADLKIADGQARQLCVRTCLARNINLAEYTRLSAQDIARRAKSGSDPRALLELYGLFASEYDYRPVDLEKVPFGSFAQQYARDHAGHFLHNYGAIQSLEKLLALVRPGGFILANDYGQTEITKDGDFEHQRFSHATFVGINFPLLKAYFAEAAGSGDQAGGGAGTGDPRPALVGGTGPGDPCPALCQWFEPKEDNGRIHSRLLGKELTETTSQLFSEKFSKAAHEWLQGPWNMARANIQAYRSEAALAAYHSALERQPYNWILMNETSLFLTFTMRKANSGVGMSREALALNPNSSSELWNTLGDAYFELGRNAEAKSAYQKGLRVNPTDVKSRYNLSWTLIRDAQYSEALGVIAEALALDETGEYYERLGKKQAEIIQRLSQRNGQRQLLVANRVSKRPEASPPFNPDANK